MESLLQKTGGTLIPSAGRTTTVADEGTHQCMTVEVKPDTPPEIRKYRKSMFAEAGLKVVHPGLVSARAHAWFALVGHGAHLLCRVFAAD